MPTYPISSAQLYILSVLFIAFNFSASQQTWVLESTESSSSRYWTSGMLESLPQKAQINNVSAPLMVCWLDGLRLPPPNRWLRWWLNGEAGRYRPVTRQPRSARPLSYHVVKRDMCNFLHTMSTDGLRRTQIAQWRAFIMQIVLFFHKAFRRPVPKSRMQTRFWSGAFVTSTFQQRMLCHAILLLSRTWYPINSEVRGRPVYHLHLRL